MARYIDADKLNYSRVRIIHADGTAGGWNAVVMSSEINNAPTANVVPRAEVAREILERIDSTLIEHMEDIIGSISRVTDPDAASELNETLAWLQNTRELISGIRTEYESEGAECNTD